MHHNFKGKNGSVYVGSSDESNKFNGQKVSYVDNDLDHYQVINSHDAARYRWLRSNAKEIVFGKPEIVTCYGSIDDKPESLDAAVDAAMKILDD